jgi:phosphatidylglycerophosphatase A
VSRFATFLATAGYVGYIPIAPGTFGSAVGLAVYAAVRWSDNVIVEGVVLLIALVMGIWAADLVEKELGKDPSAVVIDEVLGMLVTLAFINASISAAIAGFFLFRLFDVIKPYPAGRLEHLHGGPGIMLDDAMAGVYANLSLRGLIVLFPAALA